MAELPEIKVPVDFQITDTSRELVKRLIAETLQEALEGADVAFFPSEQELRNFVRAEVQKALKDKARGLHLAGGKYDGS